MGGGGAYLKRPKLINMIDETYGCDLPPGYEAETQKISGGRFFVGGLAEKVRLIKNQQNIKKRAQPLLQFLLFL